MSLIVPSFRAAGVAVSTYIDNPNNFKQSERSSKGGVKNNRVR